jgi:phage/plasmid-like protein (TIGR03299 family)
MIRTATWENVGTDVNTANNVVDALEKADLNFTVDKAPLTAEVEGQHLIVPGKMATVRSDTNKVLGIIGNDYTICQNKDAFDFINYVSDDLEFKKAGMTESGMVYIITALPMVKILSDSFQPYLIFQNGFNGRYPVRAAIAPLRIVCQNQFNIAFKEAANTVTIRHNMSMADKLLAAKETFLETSKYMQELNNQAEKLAAKPFTVFEFKAFINEILPFKNDMTEIQKKRIEEARSQLWNAYMVDDNANFRGTAWGSINAVSDWLTHRDPSRVTSKTAENQFLQVTFNPVILQQLYSRVSA